MNLKPIFIISFLLSGFLVFSQSNKINDFQKDNLNKNFGVIKNNSKVEGYYIFYPTSTSKDKKIYYNLSILDSELNKVFDKELIIYP